ncbi:MAG: hypothetical protein ACI4JC_07460 [Faecalibacterium sp.]
MSGLRALGGLLLVGCGWYAGGAVQGRVQEHLRTLRWVLQLLERLRQEIAFRRAELSGLYAQLCREGLLRPGCGQTLQTLEAPPELLPEERKCFAECFVGLGRGAAAQECERLDYYIERFRDFLGQAEKQAQTQAGLPRRLGLAAGAVLALLLF